MDVMKESMVKLSPRYNAESRSLGLFLSANVHDEVLSQAPAEIISSPVLHKHILDNLEHPSIPLRVPISTDTGISLTTWSESRLERTVRDEKGIWVGGSMPNGIIVPLG